MKEAMRYHINIFWYEPDGQFVADIPDLASCSASGDTPQEALREVLVAQDLCLEGLRALGRKVPEPRYRPAPATAG